MDFAHILTIFVYIFPNFFRFRTQGKTKSSKLKTLMKQHPPEGSVNLPQARTHRTIFALLLPLVSPDRC
jgi:hypothetical protein